MTNRGVIFVAGLALVASSCGLIGGSDDASNGGADESATASPIAALLGIDEFADFESEAGQARMIELQREVNESVVACMAAEGFEYIPPNPDQSVSFAAATSDGVEYGSPEYTARYGFGVTTQRWSQATVGPQLVGYDDSFDDRYDEVDPNQDYLDGLSDADRAAYDAALYGDSPDYPWDPSLTDEENQTQAEAFYQDTEPSGCFAKAQSDSAFASVSAFYEAFGDELFDLYAQVENDPRTTERLADIETCVSDAGLEFVDPGNAYQHWESDLNDIEQSHTTSPFNDVDDDELETMTPEQLDELLSAPVTIDDEGKAKLAVLQAEEIAIAIATDACGGSESDLRALYEEVTAEYEQRFLDDNADRVADFANPAPESEAGDS